MSEIVWGEPIAGKGKRPEWLGHDELILCNGPRVASSNLWAAATSFQLPADHLYYAQAATEKVGDPNIKPDDWTPDERTVRACIEALPNMGTGKHLASLRALEALLPDNDRALAEKIVREEFPNAASANEWALIKVALAGIKAGRIKL